MHLDIKKVGQIPPGGGWRVHGRASPHTNRKRRRVGYTYLHVAIDDYSRVAYVEAHDDETAATLVGFWRRAQGWFWANDMAVDEDSYWLGACRSGGGSDSLTDWLRALGLICRLVPGRRARTDRSGGRDLIRSLESSTVSVLSAVWAGGA